MAKPMSPEEEADLFGKPVGGKMPPPPPKEGGGGFNLFGKKAPQEDPLGSEIKSDLIDFTRRLRMTEEQYTNLRKRLQIIEKNMVDGDKKLKEDIRSTVSDVEEIQHQFHEMESKLHLIIKELENTVRSEEFKVLKRYLEMWDPSRFVTHDEVVKIIDEKLGQREG